jgi:hypothetical protein
MGMEAAVTREEVRKTMFSLKKNKAQARMDTRLDFIIQLGR